MPTTPAKAKRRKKDDALSLALVGEDAILAAVREWLAMLAPRPKPSLSAFMSEHARDDTGAPITPFPFQLDMADAFTDPETERLSCRKSSRIGYSTIRGDQTAAARAKAIDAFQNDPGTQIIVCSLTAAGVGINLQVASNVVLAELSWTDAEQMQAIVDELRLSGGTTVDAATAARSGTVAVGVSSPSRSSVVEPAPKQTVAR